MFAFRILKEWKKRLKRQRRPAWSLGLAAAVILMGAAVGFKGHDFRTGHHTGIVPAEGPATGWLPVSDPAHPTARDQTLISLSKRNGDVEVVLRRIYLCGEETRKLGRLSAQEALDLLKAHREWSASFNRSGTVVLEEQVDDLSPECRKTAYIGIDEDGNLSLFDGPPGKGKDNIVRTFFQLDVRSLESSLSKERLHELASGIRVSDKEEYNSVLSTFSDFARHRSQDVMKPAE